MYIKISRNKVEITNLESGKTVTQTALKNFSTNRTVIGNFNAADQLIRSALAELGLKTTGCRHQLKVLIQQLEGAEDGLSDIEKRAMRDLAEQAGATAVYLIEHIHRLHNEEAILELKKG